MEIPVVCICLDRDLAGLRSGKSRLFQAMNKLFYSLVIVLFALTGFVCTYKIQAEEECLSSNILCYDCDSRYDSNCADPFELSSLSLAEQQSLAQQIANNSTAPNDGRHEHVHHQAQANRQQQQQQYQTDPSAQFAAQNASVPSLRPKRMPNTMVCHGCCVKITSKTPEGSVYVKRTCTTNLQINYFMVGLVCMKESGDRGKMCFCETDYCNGQMASHRPTLGLVLCLTYVALLSLHRSMIR